MRIWSIHPKYLDSKGIVALWRETLLAKHVLEGKTKGYKNHPQLIRFKKQENPIHCINHYLSFVYDEALKRNYNFNKDKIDFTFSNCGIEVTKGQMDFERKHLLGKLKTRDINLFNKFSSIENLDANPIFTVTEGEVEDWEII
jgi:hypothetical protein